jgi:ribosomal protein S2
MQNLKTLTFYQSWNNYFLVVQRYEQFVFRKDAVLQSLERCFQFLTEIKKKRIILVTTRPRLKTLVEKTAQKIGKEALIGKWTGGRLTNQQLRPACIIAFEPTIEILNEAQKCRIPVISFINGKNDIFQKSTSNQMQKIQFLIPTSNQNWNTIFIFCQLIIQVLQTEK